MVRQWQELFNERRYSFVDIQSPDFVELAKGLRYRRQKVTERDIPEKSIERNAGSSGSLSAGNYGGERKQCIPDGAPGMQCKRNQIELTCNVGNVELWEMWDVKMKCITGIINEKWKTRYLMISRFNMNR